MTFAASLRMATAVLPGPGPRDDLAAALGTPSDPDPDWQAAPACLPGRAGRRLSPEIRLALAAAERISPVLEPDAAWVFASSNGEGFTLNVILAALMTPEMLIQPVRFQNAVHNAASGQWTIADGRQGPVSSIAAFDETAGAGLLKALVQVACEGRAVGLVVYDAPLPPPLHQKRPISAPFAAGLALAPVAEEEPTTLLRARVEPHGAPSRAAGEGGKALTATANPAAAMVPLLERIAELRHDRVRLGLAGGSALSVDIGAADNPPDEGTT